MLMLKVVLVLQLGGICLGPGSGLGVNCSVHGPLKIGDNVMMGPDVTILTQTHNIERTDFRWDSKE